MPAICILDKFEVEKNERFLKIAGDLTPTLLEERIAPDSLVTLGHNIKGETCIESRQPLDGLPELMLKKDDTVILDFGTHRVGYVTLDLSFLGSHPDAPAYLYLRFAQRPDELTVDMSNYEGWLSKGWIQEEYIHVDVLPATLELPRRYAFRYMELHVIDTSLKYGLIVRSASLRAVSAVKMEQVPPLQVSDPLLAAIDQVSCRTLHDCMQLVFEDGPKRDRRMWLGDLRLQARANYETFRNTELVKRCLYLFGALTFNGGMLAGCIFLEPEPEPDDTYLFDYALLYGSILLDYYEQTKDRATLEDLYPIALRQIDIGLSYLSEDNIIPDHSGEFWCFVDWGDGLNTQASSLAILIYAIRYALRLADCMGDTAAIERLRKKQEILKESAIRHFWDDEQKLFVSGEEKQVSWATQVWMILARVFPQDKCHELILHTIDVEPRIRMVSPYMYHHYIDALLRCGEEERALQEIRHYWGEMVQDGADTFWELYNPYNKNESPYGSVALNSFCHAWSCTPSYFLRKFFGRKKSELS